MDTDFLDAKGWDLFYAAACRHNRDRGSLLSGRRVPGVLGFVMLVSPGTVPMMWGAPLLGGLEVAGPYMFLLMGGVAALIGRGLLSREQLGSTRSDCGGIYWHRDVSAKRFARRWIFAGRWYGAG